MRNGRYCLPVKAEYRSQVQGMIHDQSSTGSTLFIEPMAVVKLNNDLRELGSKEKEEIEHILDTLSELAGESAVMLEQDIAVLTRLDFISLRLPCPVPTMAANLFSMRMAIFTSRKAVIPFWTRRRLFQST